VDELVLVLLAGAVTFSSRATFMVRPPRQLPDPARRFLDIFPLALFMALAVRGLARPTIVDGASPVPALLAAGGALLAGRFTDHALLWMLAGGAAGYWIGVLL
jgi:branched-subunit amino acid transport protein